MFGTNNGITNQASVGQTQQEPTDIGITTMSAEEYDKREQEFVQKSFGIYKEPEQAPAATQQARAIFTDEGISNLNRAEYEQIIDSFGVLNNSQANDNQSTQVQQTNVPVVPQSTNTQQTTVTSVQPTNQQTTQQQPQNTNDDFLNSIFGIGEQESNTSTQNDNININAKGNSTTEQSSNTILDGNNTAINTNIPQTTTQQVSPIVQQQTQPTVNNNPRDLELNALRQQDAFNKQMASIALHNKVNPNVVFEAMKSIPTERLYDFVMNEASNLVVQNQNRSNHTGMSNMPNIDKLAGGLSITSERGTSGNIYTKESYEYDSSMDLY